MMAANADQRRIRELVWTAAALVGIAAWTVGCGDNSEALDPEPAPGPACAEEPCLDPPADGVQARSTGLTIMPGEDRELCEVVRLPGDATEQFVSRIELAMTQGSHHLIVAKIDPGSETEGRVKEGDVIDCIGPSGFGDNITPLAASQLLTHEESYPTGVARSFVGGQFLVFNYHYFNASDAPIVGRAAINLHTIAADTVEHIMGDSLFANINIVTPPGETKTFPTDCRFDRDVMVHKLIRHTHKWGTEMPVRFAGGERDGELIYTSPDYEDPDHVFEEPVLVRAGEGFAFDCTFVNDTDHTLSFGFKATDEMCILGALIFDPSERDAPQQGCLATE